MISDIIFYLLKKGAHREPRRITTGEVADYIDVSQQTASRKLIELEKSGDLVRDGGKVFVTEKAIAQVRKLMKNVLDSLEGTSIVFSGKVVQGLGEGAYYVSQKGYKSQFDKKLCFKPYPGTLNVSIAEDDIEKRLLLREQKPIIIEGFKSAGRTFGRIDAYRCAIGGTPCAIIFPERSLHGLQMLEIISAFNLKKKHSIDNGSDVSVEVVQNIPC